MILYCINCRLGLVVMKKMFLQIWFQQSGLGEKPRSFVIPYFSHVDKRTGLFRNVSVGLCYNGVYLFRASDDSLIRFVFHQATSVVEMVLMLPMFDVSD